MVQIVVDAKTAQQIINSDGPVSIVDADGRLIGSLQRPLFSAEEVDQALQRLKEPGKWLTTEQVKEHLRNLGEKCATP